VLDPDLDVLEAADVVVAEAVLGELADPDGVMPSSCSISVSVACHWTEIP
jgi:hypothetical protein